ncbi:MAG TPA: ABC transporter substrate-binding protein [Stellaceae bacterium]|nr:ABC transporter substrate-binding protein [Stellaceae bacterium]
MIHKAREAALVAIAAAALCTATSAFAETTLTVGKANATSDAIIPVNVGDQLGFFKKHGLDLKIIDFGGGGKSAQAMAAGGIDIEDGAGTEMAFIVKGDPMIAVCESTAPAPFMAIGVPWDSPIHSLKDLKDKTIGVSSPGSFSDWLAHELSRKEGWGDSGVKTVGIGGATAATISAFRTHQIDAEIGGASQFFAFEQDKEGRLLTSVSAYEGNVASGMLFASNALVAKNPEAIRAFIAGWIETVDYMRAHKAETVKIESGITHFNQEVMSKEYDLVIGMFTKACQFDSDSLKTLQRSFVDLKLLDTEPDMAKLYTDAYLPK